MEHNFEENLISVCRLLEKHKVKYLLIGGTAVALNGYYRNSTNTSGELTEKPDIDIWYNPSYENYFNLLKTIEELGHDISNFKSEKNPNPRKSFFKLDFDHFSFDILPEIKANIKFGEAYSRRNTIEIEEIQIHFLSYNDLIEDKKATARTKDLRDIDQLKKLKDKK